jgi:hypothetical protein
MQLITMAHLGEAQGVINLFDLKRVTPNLFENDTLSCLITGEGPFEAATSVASQLARKNYARVINLGIAGALDSTLMLGEIYPVRSVYLVVEGKPQFKSFQSLEQGFDCITSFERILSAEKALPLAGVGALVDREVWGVAMAARSHSVKFESYKLVSDHAGSLSACELVRDAAEDYSQKLAQFLARKIELPINPEEEMKLDGFHFTFSTRIKFQQYLKKLSLREELSQDDILKSLKLETWLEQKILPKERTRLLLEQMEFKLDPLKKDLETGLLAWKQPFTANGIDLSTDPYWESPEVKISFHVNSRPELEHKLSLLSGLNLHPFHKLRNGELHVE